MLALAPAVLGGQTGYVAMAQNNVTVSGTVWTRPVNLSWVPALW